MNFAYAIACVRRTGGGLIEPCTAVHA